MLEEHLSITARIRMNLQLVEDVLTDTTFSRLHNDRAQDARNIVLAAVPTSMREAKYSGEIAAAAGVELDIVQTVLSRKIQDQLIHPDADQSLQLTSDGKYYRGKSASSPVGGIDLYPALLDLQIKRDGNGIPLPLNLQPAEVMDIEGILPVIINITPVTNLPMLLGFDMPEGDKKPYESADSDSTSPLDLGFVDQYRKKYIHQYQGSGMDV